MPILLERPGEAAHLCREAVPVPAGPQVSPALRGADGKFAGSVPRAGHGTYGMAYRQGCTCDDCLCYRRLRSAKAKVRKIERYRAHQFTCGTVSAYDLGCRCPECRAAKAAARRPVRGPVQGAGTIGGHVPVEFHEGLIPMATTVCGQRVAVFGRRRGHEIRCYQCSKLKEQG